MGPPEVTWSNHLLKQGHLGSVVKVHVQVAFKYPKEVDSTTVLGNLC